MPNRPKRLPLTDRCARLLAEPTTISVAARRLRTTERAIRSALDHLRARGSRVQRTAQGTFRVLSQ